MTEKIEVGKKILIANEQYAASNSRFFIENKKICLNMISSPGSGKTTILVRTIRELGDKVKIGVIEGDVRTDLDAQRILETKAPAIQIETEGACHLSAEQVSYALEKLPTESLEMIIIENVGNLVCPSAFELGETAKIAVLSITEGDDKPAKYPAIFARSKAVIINKMDLLGAVDFDIDRVRADIVKLNKEAKIFLISAKTGEGMDDWYNWLLNLTASNGGEMA